jgi:hypothetical protein
MKHSLDLITQSRIADYVFLDISKLFEAFQSWAIKESTTNDPQVIRELVSQKRKFTQRVEAVYGPQTEAFILILFQIMHINRELCRRQACTFE